MKKIILGSSIIFWTLANAAAAQILTLEQAIRSTWEKSSQLKAQKSLAGIYSDDTWRRFLPEEPQIQWQSQYNDTIVPIWGLSLTYPIPFKSLAFTQLDSAMAEQQRWEWTAQKYDLAVAIAQAYMNGATAQATIEFQQANVQDLETITEAIRLQYTHGHSNQTQKISAELQLTQAQRDLKTAQDQLKTAVELYAKLMNVPAGQVTSFELPEDVPASIIKELGGRTSGQLRDKANVDVGEANRATGFWSQIPDITFGISEDFYGPSLNDSPTGNLNDFNYSISLTLPILFPVREMAEMQRNENQGIVSREQARLQLLQDNSAQEAAAMDYARSKARYNQLHSRDLVLAETMRESAVEAYKNGRLQFSDLMLARQTYAGLKTEDIQIRAEIVNAHLTGLRNIEAMETGSKDVSLNPPPVENPSPAVAAPTAQPSPTPKEKKKHHTSRHELGANNPPEDAASPALEEDQKDSDEKTQANPLPTPMIGKGTGDSGSETK